VLQDRLPRPGDPQREGAVVEHAAGVASGQERPRPLVQRRRAGSAGGGAHPRLTRPLRSRRRSRPRHRPCPPPPPPPLPPPPLPRAAPAEAPLLAKAGKPVGAPRPPPPPQPMAAKARATRPPAWIRPGTCRDRSAFALQRGGSMNPPSM